MSRNWYPVHIPNFCLFKNTDTGCYDFIDLIPRCDGKKSPPRCSVATKKTTHPPRGAWEISPMVDLLHPVFLCFQTQPNKKPQATSKINRLKKTPLPRTSPCHKYHGTVGPLVDPFVAVPPVTTVRASRLPICQCHHPWGSVRCSEVWRHWFLVMYGCFQK